jgi:hypothetical protein
MYRAVNRKSITLYWKIGEYINQRIESEKWGKSAVEKLAMLGLGQDLSVAKGIEISSTVYPNAKVQALGRHRR